MNFSKQFWLIWLATLLFFAAFYALMIPFPLYLAEVGISDWQIGVIMGALGMTSLIVRPLAGSLTDSWGRQKILFTGTVVFTIGALGIGTTTHSTLLFGLRILQATGYVAFTTAATALVSDLVPADRRGAAMAFFGAAANVSMTLVPAAISFVLDSITLTGAFAISAIMAVVAGLMTTNIPREQAAMEPASTDTRFSLPDLLHVANKLKIPALTMGLMGIGFGAFFQFAPFLTERRELGTAGVVYTIFGISIILTRLFTARLLGKHQHHRTMIFSFLILGMGLLGYAYAFTLPLLLVATACIASGLGVLHPLLIVIHIERASAHERGRATAVSYLGMDLGIGLGAWIFAPIFEWFGLSGLYWLAAIFAFAGILLVTFITHPFQRGGPAGDTDCKRGWR